MAGRSVAALVIVALAFSLLLLFGSPNHASAETWKLHYSTTLGCSGDDGVNGTSDDSCVPGTENSPGTTADITSVVNVDSTLDGAPNKHSNYALLRTINTPPEWSITPGADVPDGALRARLTTTVTLSILNGPCSTTVPINIPLFDATTNTNNTVDWAGDGDNLLADTDGNGYPAYIDQYPKMLFRISDPDFGIAAQDGLTPAMKPLVRLAGHTFATAGAPASKLQFLIYEPGQLSQFKYPYPDRDLGDTYGYINVVQLDNPEPGTATPSPITDFCEPLSTSTKLYGETQGQGVLGVGPLGPTFDVPAGTSCAAGGGNPLCGITVQTNPAAGTGIYGGETHLTGVWGTSYRDADADGIDNNEDGCPLNAGTVDTDSDGVEDVCDPNPGTATTDIDGDGFQNRQDNCALVSNPNQADSDVAPAPDGGGADGIGDKCDPNPLDATTEGAFAADLTRDAVCLGVDTDGDGWCDAEENIVGPGGNAIGNAAVANDIPEYRGLSPALAGPPSAPGFCSNLAWYATTGDPDGPGGAIDDDGDTLANAADTNCPADLAGEIDEDGITAGDNCPTVYNPDQINTDGDAQGDACDSDDDNDGISDRLEMLFGGRSKDAAHYGQAGFALDLDGNGSIQTGDVLAFRGNTSNKPAWEIFLTTSLTAACNAGATSCTLASTAGVLAGMPVDIGPANVIERRLITNVAGNVITLDAALLNSHAVVANQVKILTMP